MQGSRAVRLAVVLGLVWSAWLASPGASRGQRLVPTADPGFPRIKYADSLVSVNDRCAVARNKLNLKVRPVYVNRRPVGFC